MKRDSRIRTCYIPNLEQRSSTDSQITSIVAFLEQNVYSHKVGRLGETRPGDSFSELILNSNMCPYKIKI